MFTHPSILRGLFYMACTFIGGLGGSLLGATIAFRRSERRIIAAKVTAFRNMMGE